MNAIALKLAPKVLRVAVFAADAERRASLTRLVGELGHVAASGVGEASVVLADGVSPSSPLPTVALGVRDTEYQGNLPSDASPEQLDAALRAVAAGLSVFVAGQTGLDFRALTEADERVLLTPRETEVLSAVANGLTNKEIARDLGISRHTVKFHLESLMRKLGVSSRAGAVSKSLGLNLLEPYRA
jgi:DNA-binding NarL/FixJ family response regulator